MIFPTLIFRIERWKFNSEYGVYVSNMGHFKDRQKRNLSCKINGGGYCSILTEKGMVKAHRVVLMTWRPIPNREEMTVDHLNHNKRDNRVANLEWVTAEENLQRANRDLYIASEDKSEKERYIKINGVEVTIDTAMKFILHGPNKNTYSKDKDSIRRYLVNFSVDVNPNRKIINKYGVILERVNII